jgi:hypothetical protein
LSLQGKISFGFWVAAAARATPKGASTPVKQLKVKRMLSSGSQPDSTTEKKKVMIGVGDQCLIRLLQSLARMGSTSLADFLAGLHIV